jgi:hypothetical protein
MLGILQKWGRAVRSAALQGVRSGFGLPRRVKAFAHGWMLAPPAKLQPYHQEPIELRHRLKKRLFVAFITFVGMIYGFMVAIFPPAFYLYMVLPVVIMTALIIWGMPETNNVSEGKITWLFFAFFLSMGIWPNYLAFDPPGLPWITAKRLFTIPMVFLFLIGLSMSPKFRDEIKANWAVSPWIFRLVLGYAIILVVTLPMSTMLGTSFPSVVNREIEWIATFFIAAWIFTRDGAARKFSIMFCWMTVFVCAVSVYEYRISAIPWAGHIPSFLVIQDETVQKMLAGSSRSGNYRTQSIFPTPLNFAEYIALSTPFFLHFLMESRSFLLRFVLILWLPCLFVFIRWTDARLGVIGFLSSFFFYFLIWAIRRWKANRLDLLGPFVVLAYPALLLAFYFVSLAWGRLRVMTWGGGVHQASNQARDVQWEMGVPKILAWPFGYGTEMSGITLGYRNGAGVITVDTYYLTVLLDVGIIGFICAFGSIIAAAGMGAYKGALLGRVQESLIIPASVSLAAFFIIKSVLSQVGNHSIAFMLLGLVAGLLYRTRKQEPIFGNPDWTPVPKGYEL